MHLLFLCVANSSRSQMAHGLARKLFPETVGVSSAGSSPSGVNPFAVEAMAKLDIDISTHTSDDVADVDPQQITHVITLCAEEVCPVFLGDAARYHWPHQDPAAVTGSREEKLASFCNVREQIKAKLIDLKQQLLG